MKTTIKELWAGFIDSFWPWETPYLFGRFLGVLSVYLFWGAIVFGLIGLFVGAIRLR